MNIKNLIPISYVKKITPLIVGDEYYDSTLDRVRKVDGWFLTEPDIDDNRFFVVSFADRPNTGKQPVGDDVVVDVSWPNNGSEGAEYHDWSLGNKANVEETWKPNHASMLKQWQAEQEFKEVESGLSDGVDWIHGSEYYKPSTKEFFRMPAAGDPATGGYAEYYSHQAQDWKINASVPASNLSRSYFIKRVEWPSCDSQENMGSGVEPSSDYENSDAHRIRGIGDILHNMSCSMTDDNERSVFGDCASFCWDMGGKLSNSTLNDKPTFTKAMADTGEFPAVGATVVFYCSNPGAVNMTERAVSNHLSEMEVVSIQGGLLVLFNKSNAFTIACNDQWIRPIQTAEQKLYTAIYDAVYDDDISDDLNQELAIELMNHPKFTITLKG
jgi:hypothetical protein